jgi:hypothetical protein
MTLLPYLMIGLSAAGFLTSLLMPPDLLSPESIARAQRRARAEFRRTRGGR